MKKVKRFFMMAMAVLACTAPAIAQEEEKVETTVAADVVNQYIWRGLDLGNVSLQPTLGVAYKGLSLTAWGSVGLESSDTKEFDLTLAYSIGGFNVGITDYWFNTGLDPENRYTNFAGNDGINANGKRAYSTYMELSAPFRFATCDWTAVFGFVPMSTTSYGTSGFAVTNLSVKATKEIRVTDNFAIPVFGQLVANPCSQKAYLVFGFTLQP